jgi:hypothetical protein
MVRAILVVCILGCGQGQRPAGPSGPAPGALACELRLRDTGARIGLSFAVVNRTASAATVHYFHPFLQFDLQATAAGRALSVVQPDVERPAQLRELAIAGGGSAELATPVSLRFASDAPANAASMVWTIDSPPTSIDLTATLRFEGEALPPCAARIERR